MRTKKQLYVLVEAALSIFVLNLFVWLCVMDFNSVFVGLSLLGSLYFVDKIVLGIKLIIDIVDGPCTVKTRFMGYLKIEHLDFFNKIYFSYVYFDDPILKKNYYLFDDIWFNLLCPNDNITMVYYKRSRIIIQLYRNNH